MSSKALNEVKFCKKMNEERKALKRKRKQQKLIQSSEISSKLKEETVMQNSVAFQSLKLNPSTISFAVPGSILENTQSPELRAYVAGQVARAAAIFRVTEIIVFDDICVSAPQEQVRFNGGGDNQEDNVRIVRRSSMQLARILQYLECPQYLRKFFFPMHKDLQYSGLLNPLDTPHHLRQQSVFRYREGVITDKAAKPGYSYANVGLLNDVMVDKPLNSGVRVTVRLENFKENSKKLRGSIVSPEEPRRETGVYWGYNVRIANCLSEIFGDSPHNGGYDLVIGTSDRGKSVESLKQRELNFNHLLIVFGGLKGLETALINDNKLTVEDPSLLFDHYINVLPSQGSRTIRTEEALLIAMSALQEKLNANVPELGETLTNEVLPSSMDTSCQFSSVTFPLNEKQKLTNREKLEDTRQRKTSKNPFNQNKTRNESINHKNESSFNNECSKMKNNLENAFEAESEHKSSVIFHESGSGNTMINDNFNEKQIFFSNQFEVVSSNKKKKFEPHKEDLSRFD